MLRGYGQAALSAAAVSSIANASERAIAPVISTQRLIQRYFRNGELRRQW
jgi:hypothetical protein